MDQETKRRKKRSLIYQRIEQGEIVIDLKQAELFTSDFPEEKLEGVEEKDVFNRTGVKRNILEKL